MDFNPRSLAGATALLWRKLYASTISIHAPLRERPQPSLADQTFAEISIHAPLRERLRLMLVVVLGTQISIHAPLRERPFLVSTVIPFIQISIHAPLRERPGYNLFRSPTLEFQSTLPCGSDLVTCVAVSACNNFNPRSLAGATFKLGFVTINGAISIHAPLRERRQRFIKIRCFCIFQSTLPCGSDFMCRRDCFLSILFQSTLPCGSDQKFDNLPKLNAISIHAPLRERLLPGDSTRLRRKFQSTLPCGSDNGPFLRERMLVYFNPRSLAGATLFWFAYRCS